jgi:hypothetical protein
MSLFQPLEMLPSPVDAPTQCPDNEYDADQNCFLDTMGLPTLSCGYAWEKT